MLEALLRKEWRQLRTLRWGGVIVGLSIPWVLVLGAEVGRQGWLPTRPVSAYSFDLLLAELAPGFFLALWGLLALMISVQAQSGDRTEGTERFLLERPVSRRTVWSARLAAAAGTTAVVIAVHTAYLGVLVRLFDEGRPFVVSPLEGTILTSITVLCGFLGGLAAASAFGSFQAVMLGLVLATLPAGVAAILSAQFPFAAYRAVPVGAAVSVILLFGYVVTSYAMLCRGEPEGRGRWLRGGIVLAVSLVAVPVLFVGSAPLAMRMEAGRFEGGPRLDPAPSGDAAVVLGSHGRSGWIVDLDSGDRHRFLPPGIWGSFWNGDGTRLAVVHESMAFGARASGIRLDVFDDAGRSVWRDALPPSIPFMGGPVWAGKYLLARTTTSKTQHRIVIADVETGHMREVTLDVTYRDAQILGPTDDGSVYVFIARLHRASTQSEMRRLDLKAARLGESVLHEEAVIPNVEFGSSIFLFHQELSPSGRFLKRQRGFVDVQTGAWIDGPEVAIGVWLEDNLYARVVGDDRKRLLLGRPGEDAIELGRWENEVVFVNASPDRRLLMIQVWSGLTDPNPAPGDYVFEQRQRLPLESTMIDFQIVEAVGGKPVDFGEWREDFDVDLPSRIRWAGPARLARVKRNSIAVRGLTPTDRFETIVGR